MELTEEEQPDMVGRQHNAMGSSLGLVPRAALCFQLPPSAIWCGGAQHCWEDRAAPSNSSEQP